MFDWNDEELTNIIWGEAGESDDHIVPYPGQIEKKPSIFYGDPPKKETNQQTSNTSPPEQKNPPTKAEHGVELDNISNYDTDETAEFKKDSEIFENPSEDGEQGDFVDYGWANIGSFDDLDRIFSNQDPIFGDMSVGHADELWSPSKDVTSSSLGTTPLSGNSSDLPFRALRTSIDRSEIKDEYLLDTNQPLQTPATGGRTQACPPQLNDGTAATPTEIPGNLFSCVQANRQKRLMKRQKLDNKSEVRKLHNSSSTWTSSGSTLHQVNGQYAPSMINPGPPLVLTQQSSLPRLEPFQQKYFPSAPLGTPLYGNMVNHYPTTSVLPQFHPGDENHELISSSYEVPPPASSNSIRNSEDALEKPPAMTPKEKIEKLRRRQQMRAILAIQKQQLQFGNQVSVSEHSCMEEGKIDVNESLGIFPSLEQNSPAEQYDSSAISMTFDNCSAEESTFYRLQDTIAKLDVQIRLCIRDSLFRLAQSAVQRQYHNDTISASTSNIDEFLCNKDIVGHERFTRMPDVETDTNPIDRAVAHLLFHRPFEFSGTPADAPDSPLSASLPYEKKSNPSESLTKGHFAESFMNTQITSPQGSKEADLFSEGDQSKNAHVFVTSENVSNTENTSGVQGRLKHPTDEKQEI